MSSILRWFHDGDTRYRAYFRNGGEAAPRLVIAAKDGRSLDIGMPERPLDGFCYEELLAYARRLRVERAATVQDAAAD